MALPSNPGFGSSFDAAAQEQFKSAIKSTMQMATPNAINDQVTFQWNPVVVHTNTNSSGRPFDFNATPVSVTSIDDVQVDCAVEFLAKSTIEGSPMGEFEHPRVIITLLNEDYERIKTADKVRIGGNNYEINFTQPPTGFFQFDIYQIHCTAVDES